MPTNFYDKKTSGNPPFQPYYSNLHTISYQKMHIASLVQFMPKKTSRAGPCGLEVRKKTYHILQFPTLGKKERKRDKKIEIKELRVLTLRI